MHLGPIDLAIGIAFCVAFMAVVDHLWDKDFMDE